MEMVSTITSLITNVVNFAGGLLLLFGAVTLGTNLKDHNGPGISNGAWSIAGGVLIIAVATYNTHLQSRPHNCSYFDRLPKSLRFLREDFQPSRKRPTRKCQP